MKKNNLFTIFPVLLFTMTAMISCTGQSVTGNLNPDQSTLAENDKTEMLNELLGKYAEYGEFNGAVLVAEEGEVVFKKGYGFSNMEWNIQNQTNTKFRIGSITKQFTAMLIVQLVSENKLDLHKSIANYLPDYPKENADKITIHHLLTHTSGTPNSYESTKRIAKRPDSFSAEELVDEFSALPLEFTPGEKFRYSNAGYSVLGMIIEKLTHKRLEQALKDKILTPLGMNNTGFEKHRQLTKNRAAGYFKSWGEYYNANYVDMSTVFAAGAMYSTVEDLFLWDQALYSDKLVPLEYLDLIFTKHIPDPDYGGYYAYGWSIQDKPLGNTSENIETIGHDGVIDGFCAIFTRTPSSKSSIVLLSNIRRAPLNAMSKGIMGILSDKPYDFPKKSLAFAMLAAIEKDGIKYGIELYRKQKENNTYYFIEDEINIISYKLLQSDRAEYAAEVLKLGIEAFPDAFNLYDSYGEILRNLGKKEESILNYTKSVQLNPDNENGFKMLKELGVDTEKLKK